MPSIRKPSSSSSPKRERRSEVAGRALVAAWQASGLCQAVFARRRGMSAQRLSYWRLRLGQRGGLAVTSGPGFVEIPSATPPARASPGEVVVEVGDGVRMRVAPGFDPGLLRSVVAALATPVPGC